MPIQVDISNTLGYISDESAQKLLEECSGHLFAIQNKKGKGSDFLGWVNLPSETPDTLLKEIEQTAASLRDKSEVIVVVGIGGSYLGARALIDALNHSFQSLNRERRNPVVLYAGNNLAQDYIADLTDILNQYDYSIIVISKSGTTTEPAIAFRILKNHIEKKYGKAAAKDRIVAITDAKKGVLKSLADAEGYQSYVIPDDVGGRFSVLTPVGLLPVAAAGFDIQAIMNGAKNMQQHFNTCAATEKNPCIQYAIARNLLYKKGKTTEILASYNPSLQYLSEWWKQLFGESEGKENKGIFPASVSFTADLHSMGQYIQEGLRNIFETVLSVHTAKRIIVVPQEAADADQLNFLAGKELRYVNQMAEEGTILAHAAGKVPNIRIQFSKVDEAGLGELIYFFEMSCAISGYLLGVNPFDQPGVEAYKNNMFALLDKPGYEKQTETIRKLF
ncbi:MAG: glucose-6-phosphate isomerase [Bacteroidota bacterium]